MRLTFLLLFFFALTAASAQDSCQCLVNLNHMIDKVSHNYSGYHDKVNAKTEKDYNNLVDSLRKSAANASNLGDCQPILEKYRLFFYDKHLQLGMNIPVVQSAPGPKNDLVSTLKTDWDKQKVLAYFNKNKKKLNPIEGVWNTEGYEVGVIFNSEIKEYQAIVFQSQNGNWREGMSKFRAKPLEKGLYEMAYFNGRLEKTIANAHVFKNFLEIDKFGTWQKTFPTTKDTITAKKFSDQYAQFGMLQFRYLNDTTLYIALKSCDLSLKPVLDSLVKANAEKLKKTPAWIVDFRGNEGGSTDVFQSLLPYLYTKPMFSKGNKHWMTPAAYEELNRFTNENKSVLDSSTLVYLTQMVEFGKNNPNGWFDDHGDTTRYDKVLSFPRRVAVLSDKNNASSGETFLIVARGLSDKVVIMGENSAGYLDYGDLLPYKMPCENIRLSIPSRRANYLDYGESYDKMGYKPDIYIPSTTKDWVQFVFDYWKKH